MYRQFLRVKARCDRLRPDIHLNRCCMNVCLNSIKSFCNIKINSCSSAKSFCPNANVHLQRNTAPVIQIRATTYFSTVITARINSTSRNMG